MEQTITIKKDPIWLVYIGVILTLIGSFSFVPANPTYWSWETISDILFIAFVLGSIILIVCSQKIGWRLTLEGNVFYYQKFDLYSSWKKRRSREFSLPIENITSAAIKKNVIQIKYKSNRELKFNILGMQMGAFSRLHTFLNALETSLQAP
ncbi:MAG: hypothetical protein VXY91_03400 [Bacteroidota bacterium]|nr:hypothetical protein [Bacteroidota bacterium]